MKQISYFSMISTLSLMVQFSAYAGGGSYTGPDLSGLSIATPVESKSSLNAIKALTDKCMYDTLVDLWQQLYRDDFVKAAQAQDAANGGSESQEGGARQGPHLNESQFRSNHFSSDYTPNACIVTSILAVGDGQRDVTLKFSKCSPTVAQLTLVAPRIGQNYGFVEFLNLESIQTVPFYRLSSQVTDASLYDAYGRLNPQLGDALLSFQLITQASAADTSSTGNLLINSATHINTSFRLQLDTYSQCLRQNLP